jgi:putative intracellular protease/amidase
VIGPAEVFAGADALAGPGAYTVEVVAKEPEPIAVRSSGYGIVPKTTTARCRGPIDTLVIAGGFGVAKAETDAALIRWIRSAARRSRRVTSVCSGAFLLARAGLLEGKTCTTHWASTASWLRRHLASRSIRTDLRPRRNVWIRRRHLRHDSPGAVEEDPGDGCRDRPLLGPLPAPGGQARSAPTSAQLAGAPLRET